MTLWWHISKLCSRPLDCRPVTTPAIVSAAAERHSLGIAEQILSSSNCSVTGARTLSSRTLTAPSSSDVRSLLYLRPESTKVSWNRTGPQYRLIRTLHELTFIVLLLIYPMPCTASCSHVYISCLSTSLTTCIRHDRAVLRISRYCH